MRTIDKINYYLTKENKNGADLCEYLGVSSGVYSQWNTGRTHPRKSKLPIIAEYLGVEVSDIQGDDTNKKEKPTAQGDGLKLDSYEDIDQWLDTLDGKGLDMVIAMAAAKKVKVNEDKS